MCHNQTGDISTLNGNSLKIVDKFTYRESSVPSTEKDIDTLLIRTWTAIDKLSIIWKSDLTDKLKRSSFQAAVVSILLYGCTAWALTKRMEKRLDGNYTKMLRAIWTSPGGNTSQSPNCTAIYFILRNYQSESNQACRTLLEKQGRAHIRCSSMDPIIWPNKNRTTCSNLHTAALWWYGM